ncbi:MAG: shikimate kinase [Magnetococcales bacterium]|nr:shikimate kinase [Magnetococcales bacterium]
MNIVLIGPRGVGKSSVGRALGRLSKWPLLSTDLLIRYENQGRAIPEILQAAAGDWRIFRELEWAVVEKIARLDQIIIDTGGGVVVDLDDDGQEIYSTRKMTALKQHGFVVHLTGDPARLAAWTSRDPGRPALSARVSEEAIMRRRAAFYHQAADLTLDTATTRCAELAAIILRHCPAAG